MEEFKTDQCRVLVTKNPACHVEMNVYASGELVKKARQKAIKTVGKDFVQPGYRKGKAPDEVILSKLGEHVEDELKRHLADIAYVEAQKQARIPLLNNNSKIHFEMKALKDNEGHLYYSFEKEPSIPSVEPKDFQPKPVDREPVEEKHLNEAIHQMRFYYAKWDPVQDRPVQEGDYLMITLDTVEEDGSSERVFDHVRFEVSSERMAEWMKKLVIGAKEGDVLDGISEPDPDASKEDLAEFKPKKVKLTINKVEMATLPELDDEFARKVGAESVDAMRTAVMGLLNARSEEKVQQELREQVNDFLVEKYPFELPKSLVDTEKKHRQEQLMQNPKFKESWDKMSAEERAASEANLEKESGQAVRLFYLSRQIVNDAKITVTHKDIQDEAMNTLRSFGAQQQHMDKIPKEIYALALSKIILAKAQDHIIQAQKA